MADFETALAVALGPEGTYANESADPGGETYRGISRVYWPDWKAWYEIDIIKRGFTTLAEVRAALKANKGFLDKEVGAFYYRNFWARFAGDAVASQAIANELLEEAINLDVPFAVRNLQFSANALNLYGKRWPDLVVDGKAGRKTLAVIAAIEDAGMTSDVLMAMNIEQGHYYLKSRNEAYIRGWLGQRVEL